MVPATASAHPLGNFTVNRYSLIDVGRGSVSVRFVVDMAEIPTFQALGGAGTRDGRAILYAQREAPRWVRGLDLRVDGRRVPLSLVPGSVRASLRPGQAGLSIMRAELTATAAVSGAGSHAVTYREAAFGNKVGWREIVVAPRRRRRADQIDRRHPGRLGHAPPLSRRPAAVAARRSRRPRWPIGTVQRRERRRRGARRPPAASTSAHRVGLHLAGRAPPPDARLRRCSRCCWRCLGARCTRSARDTASRSWRRT